MTGGETAKKDRWLYECPGLEELKIEGEDGTAWVLWGADNAYAVGTFDGAVFRPEAARLTRSNVRCWARPRQGDPKNPWKLDPTPYSGYCPNDPLQPSGLLGPVRVLR